MEVWTRIVVVVVVVVMAVVAAVSGLWRREWSEEGATGGASTSDDGVRRQSLALGTRAYAGQTGYERGGLTNEPWSNRNLGFAVGSLSSVDTIVGHPYSLTV